ncbi:hypothetical protein, partial [Enterococcus faecalis]|uniref:hypothetical protein n=1 Tax=Enterococcus faecalis TaxID=1351 RepID=UPI003CC67796
ARGMQAPSAPNVKRDKRRDLPGRRLTIVEAPAMNGKCLAEKRCDEGSGLFGLFEWIKRGNRNLQS